MMISRAALAAALVLGFLAAPLPAVAQQAPNIPRIGLLSPFSPAELPQRSGHYSRLRRPHVVRSPVFTSGLAQFCCSHDERSRRRYQHGLASRVQQHVRPSPRDAANA